MTDMSDAARDLAILYEHPQWFEPLFAALDRRGVAYVKSSFAGHHFDPQGSPPPAPVVFSRLAMSSFLREAEHPIFYARSLFAHWAARGARVLNAKALDVDASKARQLSVISALGLLTPETRVVHRRRDLIAAAAGLRFPVLVKADIGGSGAGIVRYDSAEELAAAAEAGETPVGVNGVALLQEYSPRRDDRVYRVETLDGRFLYAMEVESPGETFDLCPADACLVRPGAAALSMTRFEPPAEIVAAAEAIVQAARLDIGSVEYLIDDRDGSTRFYDLNALSNFVARPLEVLGFDPHEDLVDWLVAVIAGQKALAS